MNKFDTLVEEVEKSLVLEAPDYFPDEKIKEDYDVEKNQDLIKIKKTSKKLEDFINHEVFLNETSEAYKKVFIFNFVKDGKNQSRVVIFEEKTTEYFFVKSKKPPIVSTNYILESVSQLKTKENVGLTRSIVLDYLPKFFPFLISGPSCNSDGKDFWQQILNQALERGFKVESLSKQRTTNFEPETFEDHLVNDPLNKKQYKRGSASIASKKLFKITFDEN